VPTLPLEECMSAIIDYRGKTPRKTSSGVPLITAKVVKRGRICTPDEFIDPSEYDEWMRRGLPQVGDVVITTEAPLGEVAQLSSSRIALAQRLILLRGKPGVLDNAYLKYLLMSDEMQAQLASRASGTTVVGIKQSELRKLTLSFPTFGDQQAIAAVLGALDDKIEQNHTTRQALEALARATFKAWFVDFEPVKAKIAGQASFPGMRAATFAALPNRLRDSALGPVPEGWEVKTIHDLCHVVDCLHTKKPEQVVEGGRLLLQLNNIRDDGLLELSNKYVISAADYSRWAAKFETQVGDLVITNVGRVGAIAQIPPGVDAALGRNMTGLRPRSDFPYPTFLLEALLSSAMREEIERNTDTGTILSALNVKNIGKLRLVVPPDDMLTAVETALRPMRALMEHGLDESRELATLRDYLLPRLLSRRARVVSAERLTGEAP
jgi:type I restriction enzyme S subunit